MNTAVNTVNGPISPEQLGRTLIHEHVFVQYGGAGDEYMPGGSCFDDALVTCCRFADRILECGVKTIIDPTPFDLGRNVRLMAEVSARTGLQIICATGIYSAGTYVRERERRGSAEAVEDLFMEELTEGIGDTGSKAGVIKVVTGRPPIGTAEHQLLLLAAGASAATGAPVITHTEGVLGEQQQRLCTGAGAAADRLVIGHSCLSTDFDYHARIAAGGSCLGFDRFGMEGDMPDEVRAQSLCRLVQGGYADRLLMSHDSVWYWVDGPALTGAFENWKPTNIFERVIPMLHYGGVTDEQIETILCDNPRRLFGG